MVISVVEFQVRNYKINSGLDRNLFFTAMEKSPCFQNRNIKIAEYIFMESVRLGSLTQNEVSV